MTNESDERTDGGGYAVLISLSMREEAEVTVAALRADGIDAFVGPGMHVTNDWFIVHALGGVQILVPKSLLSEARQALRARIAEAAAQQERADDVTIRRDRWRVWVLALLYSPALLLSVAVISLAAALLGLGKSVRSKDA